MAFLFFAAAPDYAPPEGAEVDFLFVGGYSAPSGDDVDFLF